MRNGVGAAVEGRPVSGVRPAALDPMAALAIEELRSGRAVVDPCLIEVLAAHAHEVAASASLDDLCAAVGCRREFVPNLPDAGLLLPNGLVLVKPRRDGAQERLVTLHELAHWILERSGVVHTHADVWALALALGAPRADLERLRREGRLEPIELAAETGLPAWAAEARIERL